jgi:hypothetical protein
MLRFAMMVLVLLPIAAWAKDDLTGTWNVTIRPRADRNTCDKVPKVEAHQWLLAQNGDKITVQVTGSPLFSRLQGTIQERQVLLEGWTSGPGIDGLHTTAVYRLTASKGSLSGEFLYLGTKKRGYGSKSMCITEYEVVAKQP